MNNVELSSENDNGIQMNGAGNRSHSSSVSMGPPVVQTNTYASTNYIPNLNNNTSQFTSNYNSTINHNYPRESNLVFMPTYSPQTGPIGMSSHSHKQIEMNRVARHGTNEIDTTTKNGSSCSL